VYTIETRYYYLLPTKKFVNKLIYVIHTPGPKKVFLRIWKGAYCLLNQLGFVILLLIPILANTKELTLQVFCPTTKS